MFRRIYILWNWLLHIYHLEPLQRDLIRLLLCLSNPGPLPAQELCQPKIPVSPRSQSTQDPSQPKIPVSPRSQSALDALMPIWHLAHAYLIFGSCLFGIWLMQLYFAHVKFTSTKFFKHILHYMAKVHFSKLKKMNETRTCYIFI